MSIFTFSRKSAQPHFSVGRSGGQTRRWTRSNSYCARHLAAHLIFIIYLEFFTKPVESPTRLLRKSSNSVCSPTARCLPAPPAEKILMILRKNNFRATFNISIMKTRIISQKLIRKFSIFFFQFQND